MTCIPPTAQTSGRGLSTKLIFKGALYISKEFFLSEIFIFEVIYYENL